MPHVTSLARDCHPGNCVILSRSPGPFLESPIAPYTLHKHQQSTFFGNSPTPMWLIVRLVMWSLLSSATTAHDDELFFADQRAWIQCLALLSSDKSCPTQTGFGSGQHVCHNWRPKLAVRTGPLLDTPCVFSQTSFRNEHGVTLITTSEVVSDLLVQGVLDERDGYDLHSSLSSWDIVPGPVPDPQTGVPAYEVRNLPGKGKGVVALRPIKRNETFLLDHPAVLVTWSLAGLSTKAGEALLKVAINQLPEDARERVLGLSRANLFPDLPLCDLFKTNICGLLLGAGAPHVGLFAEFARINHACIPNAFYRVSPRDLMIEVVAFRDIEPGEEIYINYAPHTMPYKERRQYLESEYGFTCECSLCGAPQSVRAISDLNRVEMTALRGNIDKALRRRHWSDAARIASEALERLSKAEVLAPGFTDYSLTPLYLDHYEQLAAIHLKLGDVATAKSYGEKALEMTLHLRGVHSHDAEDLRRFLREIGESRFHQS